MARDPNLVTSDTTTTNDAEAAKAAAETAAPETAAEPALVAGQVLKKGAPPPKPTGGKPGEELVTVRITKKGHGEVHDGEGGRYDWNDEVALPRSIATALEERALSEIQD